MHWLVRGWTPVCFTLGRPVRGMVCHSGFQGWVLSPRVTKQGTVPPTSPTATGRPKAGEWVPSQTPQQGQSQGFK